MINKVGYMRWLACKISFLSKFFKAYQQYTFFFCILFFSNPLWAKLPVHLFIGISGGYGDWDDAYASTGTNGLIRFAFGSLWPINSAFVLGDQLGFQTGSQIRLASRITEVMGNGNVPTVLNIKNPIDFLLLGRYVLHEPLFFQVKGGGVFVSSTISGADMLTKNTFIPEVQAGMGFNVYKRSRVTVSYQQFFGTDLVITQIDPIEGTYHLQGVPTWRGILLTFEHDL